MGPCHTPQCAHSTVYTMYIIYYIHDQVPPCHPDTLHSTVHTRTCTLSYYIHVCTCKLLYSILLIHVLILQYLYITNARFIVIQY